MAENLGSQLYYVKLNIAYTTAISQSACQFSCRQHGFVVQIWGYYYIVIVLILQICPQCFTYLLKLPCIWNGKASFFSLNVSFRSRDLNSAALSTGGFYNDYGIFKLESWGWTNSNLYKLIFVVLCFLWVNRFGLGAVVEVVDLSWCLKVRLSYKIKNTFNNL